MRQMGGPGDPFADLSKRVGERKHDYLFRLTTDEATFKLDPLKNGVAKRRGFLKGQGPRPTCSLADQDAAANALRNNLGVWTDTPCARAGTSDPWDSESLHTVIARLTLVEDKDAFKKSRELIIPAEPPDPQRVGLRFRALLSLLREFGEVDRGGVRAKIRNVLGQARDSASQAPDYNPSPAFDAPLIELVVESIDLGADPDAKDSNRRDELVGMLGALVLERELEPDAAQEPTIFGGGAKTIGADRARKLVAGLYALLPSAIVIDLVHAAVTKGRPGPYQTPTTPGWERPPNTREKPPSTYERPPSSWEPPPSSREKPPSTYENPHPPPPPPRGDRTLLNGVWDALYLLAAFGRLELDRFTVRTASLAVTSWFRGGNVPEGQPVDHGHPNLIQELFGNDTWVPDGFQWPDYSGEGIYWWRFVIYPECMKQCYTLNETADFHTTDLIRFLQLFKVNDQRIPEYVRVDAGLALTWFKYWFDEPPAKKRKADGSEGDDQAEMTMWSENHQILFAQSQLLAGAQFRDKVFPRTGDDPKTRTSRTGQSHLTEGLARAERWLDNRLRFGFSEWNAPGYYNEDFPPLFNLVDFCNPRDPRVADAGERQALERVRTKAAMVLDLMVFDCARFTCRGSFGATAGRAYWEHKAYGWEQSIGDTIEILFGTRGDYVGTEPAAVAFATSTYIVPEALLAIGLDRVVLDRFQPFIDRSRVSISFDDAAQWGIGFENEDDVAFWWGLEAYYTDKTLESTKRVVDAHDNLRLCDPFSPLYAIYGDWLRGALLDLLSVAVDLLNIKAAAAVITAVPFPFNAVWAIIARDNIIEAVSDFFKDVWHYLKSITKSGPWKGAAEGAAGGALIAGPGGAIVGGVGGFFAGLAGGGEDKKPQIPDTALQALLEKLLVTFNNGTVLSTANIVTYNNGDAMLSSIQNHLPGEVAFQKQPWMANLGCDACVWTTARFMAPDVGSYVSAWGRLFKDLGLLRFHDAAADLAETPVLQALGKGSDMFGHDGPNYWTGSLTLPMVVQHENAAIIAYDLPAVQRSVSGFSTHAWFPKAKFDDTRKVDANGGTWFFGRKVHTQDGTRVGCGYVALFSATKGDWTNEGGNAWNDKEIRTDGPGANVLKGSNIWICVVSSEAQYADAGAGKEFDKFCEEIQNAYLHISGVGSPYQVECSFDIPRAKAPAGRSPRLELFYDDRKGRFAGDDIQLDGFPRFENRYIQQVSTTAPRGTGVRPQVERYATSNAVGFGSRAYTIVHPPTGLTLDHNLDTPARRMTSQEDKTIKARLAAERLKNGALTTIRRPRRTPAPPREHPLHHPRRPLRA